MNLAILGPLGFGIAAFILCAVVKRYLPLRLVRPAPSFPPAPRTPERSEAIQSIRTELQALYRQLDDAPAAAGGLQKKSAIGILYRCGISTSDIAQQLRLSRGEVDLAIQIDRSRAQRLGRQLTFSESQ